MRGALDPVTRQKIEAFARRRRALILVRGVCAVFTILLALMSALALLDYFVLMSDGVRWALSLSAYGAAFAAGWATCARMVWRPADPREMARLIEQVRPELREDLLSAVEVGTDEARPQWESEAFREALQEGVAGRIRGIDVAGVLSLSRIRRWLLATGAMAGACAALFLVPGLRFDHLLHRALRPMANLERISRVQVSILEPRPPEREVPQSDVVLVRVETAGPETRRVVLETFADGKKPERAEMAPAGGRRFESSIAVGREAVAYRILAGDAVTRKYVLTAVPRPEAVAFHKTFVYPEYAGKEPRRVSEPSGDLVELEGTTAELQIEVSQPVSRAELRIEQAGKSRVETLSPHKDPRRFGARVPIAASGTYRVHLESLRSGTVIENKFSPQYEIRAMPDLLPKVTLDEPRGDLLVPPLEVVSVRGRAKDDLGLRLVAQAVRVNQGDWAETPLARDAGAEAPVSRRWDLYELGVHPGDRITTKLVAVDLKGNRAESAPVHVVISSPGFDPQRHVPLVAKKMAYDALVELRDQVRGLGKKVSEAAALAASDELPRRQALLNAAQESEKVAQKAEEADGRIREALRLARAGRESSDLVLAAVLVRRLREESLQGGRAEIEKAGAAAEAPAAQALLRRAEAAFRRATELAQGAEESYREILASEEAVAALNDVRDLAREQQAIHRQLQEALAAKDPRAWERLSRREGVAADQVGLVESVLQVLALHAPDGQARRVARVAQELQAAREALRKAAEGAPGPDLGAPAAGLQNAVNSALQQLHGLEQELARRGEKAGDALEKRAEPNAADVAAAGRELDELSRAEKALAAAPSDARQQAAREQADRAVRRWKAARAQLEGRAGVEEARRDSDAFFVSDAALAGKALEAVLATHEASPDPDRTRETLGVVERAFRALETGHRTAELALALRSLAEQERWRGGGPDASSRHPKDWRWMEERVRAIPEEFKAGGLPQDPARAFVKAWQGPAGEAVRREMAERSGSGRRPAGAAPSLDRLAADLAQLQSAIRPRLEEARRDLRNLVPSLSERLKLLAGAAERIQEKTSGLADRTPQAEAAQVRPEARQLLDHQQGLDRQIDEVMAELRRDANTQNLFTPEGREKARDADDAVAMLKQSPPKAEDLLRQAAASPETKAQEHALEGAAEQQGKLAEALKTLARHYENAERGKPEETRPELRKAEEALGIRKQLDAQYAQMEKLAQLAQQSSEAMKQALAEELKRSEAMQRELAELTQEAIRRAEEKLQQSAQMERQAARQLEAQAQKEGQGLKGLAEQAREVAEEARRMARQDLPELAKLAREANAAEAQKPIDQARKSLDEGAKAVPQDFSSPPEAAQGLERAAAELGRAAEELQKARQAAQQRSQAAQQAAQKEAGESAKAQQKAQQEGAQAQAAQASRAAAEKAAQAAREAAKAAQGAAEKQPEDAAAREAARQAAAKAEQSEAQARQAQGAARKEAGEAQAAEEAAQAEAAQAQAAQAAAQQAQGASDRAGEEAGQAQALAQKARQLARQSAQRSDAQQGQRTQQAQTQQQVGQTLESAQSDIQQAARNQETAGQAESAGMLGEVARGVEGVRKNEVAQAAQAQGAAPAAQAAARAEQAIQAQAQALAKAAQAAAPSAQGDFQEGQLSEAAAEFLAQALNALNAQGQAPGEGPPGQPGPAQQAAESAAQSQQQAMSQQRSQGQPGRGQPGRQPGQAPFSQAPGAGKGAQVESGPLGQGELPEGLMLRPGEWGKLPPRLARDLLEARREGVSGEYRQMVETYFRVVAERAREKK